MWKIVTLLNVFSFSIIFRDGVGTLAYHLIYAVTPRLQIRQQLASLTKVPEGCFKIFEKKIWKTV